MLQKSKLYCLYKIKETNSRLIHLCLNENDELLVSFSQKTYFDEDISCDLSVNANAYKCYFEPIKGEEFNAIQIKNTSRVNFVNYSDNCEVLNWISLLGELLFYSKTNKVKKISNILNFIEKNSTNQHQNICILCKIIILIIKNNLQVEIQHKYKDVEDKLLINNYVIIANEISINDLKHLLIQYYDILEQYGLELYGLKNL